MTVRGLHNGQKPALLICECQIGIVDAEVSNAAAVPATLETHQSTANM